MKYIHFFEYQIDAFLNSEAEIINRIDDIEARNHQKLLKEKLFKELWTLRCIFFYLWFLNLFTPITHDELNENLSTMNQVIVKVLNNKGKLDYQEWLLQDMAEYFDNSWTNYEKFHEEVLDKISEKMPRIAFECTEGRLAGELHDSVVELIMTTIQEDQKKFELSENTSLTEEESQDIEKTIKGMSPTNEDFENFIDSLDNTTVKN